MSVIQSKTIKLSDGKVFKANIEAFDSTMELVTKCKERKITDKQFHDMENYDMNENWHGVKSYAEALELMNSGWSEQVSKLEAVVTECKQRQTQKRISFQNNVHGFAPIVPLALLGVPNAMINSNYKQIRSKIITINYDMAINCGNSAEQLTKNGRELVKAILMLENGGYRVNLNIMQGYSREDSADILTVRVKSANQPIDLKRICFPAMHAAFFRVIGFDWYSKFPIGKYRSGYGTNLAVSLGGKCYEAVKKLLGDDSVYISGKLIQDKGVDYIVTALKEGKYEF